MKKILIPTDFSELADYAYRYTHSLFASEQLEIHLLSVVTVTPDILFDELGEIVDDGVVDFTQLESLKNELEESMEIWMRDKHNIAASRVKLGRLTDDILNYIKEYEIDMVVMGTSGATGMKEIISGSNTAYLSMRSPVPVLSVKSDKSDESINKVLMAGDFRDPQMVNLSIIKHIIRSRSAQVHFLKVNTPGDFETNQTVILRMKEFAELNEFENPSFHVYCDYSVEKGIVSFSNEQNIDLIAIGNHQRTGLSRVIKRSISYEIINHVQQTIITFPVK